MLTGYGKNLIIQLFDSAFFYQPETGFKIETGIIELR